MVEGLISREDGVMPAPRKYPDELRERVVRLVRGLLADAPGLSMTKAGYQIAASSSLRLQDAQTFSQGSVRCYVG